MTECNEWKTKKRHECTNIGKLKRLELWWKLYDTSLPERDIRNFRTLDFCWTECTCKHARTYGTGRRRWLGLVSDMDRRLASVKRVVHFRGPYKQIILCLVARVYMSFFFFFVSSRVDWSNARPRSSTKNLQHSGTSRRKKNLNLKMSQPSSLKNMIRDYYLLWCCHFCSSGVLYWQKHKRSELWDFPALWFISTAWGRQAAWLTGCRYTFVYGRK